MIVVRLSLLLLSIYSDDSKVAYNTITTNVNVRFSCFQARTVLTWERLFLKRCSFILWSRSRINNMFINSSRKFTVKSWMKCLSMLQRPTWKLKEKLVVKLKSIPNLTNEHVPCYAPCCKMGRLKIITEQIVCMLLLGFGSVMYWAGLWTANAELKMFLNSIVVKV